MTVAKRFDGMTREINLLAMMGSLNAKSRHCTLNPACDLAVDHDDYCNFFSAKSK